ncbi:MetQ/NlpA family ABC transporter substrate-binding protein [Streptomyces albidoflavus]|uniref:MetQ/NlpA family ABC transporter substrate-binding protein n=1 Tax=Streptomyces TaxID=1883 RepID=UPI001A388F91|nr:MULTISPECIES: MetQ/NlpA family ABC transporter substrate-binding protein [unclassified Streptomyces]MBL0780031.1 MetQ/NlpA family ABC transporter substrate-binding protein [Streptomyces albidoflavus]MBL0802230.1 MetQ/NlpA family ABC transporter substrate-binding protein [Streptomyces albidoflavus]MCG5117638.1 MetQ/NlpA family ABC transporter substrate-binding protein [Streptomyces sp. T7(2022)]MCK2144544.1 MetQ/NlpA family ABC transporter substrate-binding protein [Streptomyces sp. WAC00276]
MRKNLKITTAFLATGALALGLSACGGSESDSAGGDKGGPLTVAASPTPHAVILDYVKQNLAKDAGLELDVKEFTDYVLPNTATEDGSVDANFFQHQPYLDDFQKKNGTQLTSVVPVHLEPLGLYSNKIESADDLKKGATVALPNDTTNEARALQLLADEGIIELKKGAGEAATPKDIAKNPKDLQFKELEAAQVPRSLDDVDAAIVNGNYAVEADLSPKDDSLILEKAEGNPYANLLVVKEGEENDPRVKKLAELLHSPEVKKFIEDEFKGSVLPAF